MLCVEMLRAVLNTDAQESHAHGDCQTKTLVSVDTPLRCAVRSCSHVCSSRLELKMFEIPLIL